MLTIIKTIVISSISFSSSTCQSPKLINMNNADQQDLDALDSATKSCPKRFDDAPCLKTFKKVEQGIYEAICGQ